EGVIPIVVIPDMKKNRRYTIPSRYHELFPPMEIGTKYPLVAKINGNQGTGRLWLRMHRGRESLLLTFHQNLASEIDQWSVGQHIYLPPVHDSEGDKLSEIHVTNDPPLPDSPEPASIGSVPEAKNYLFLSVRPDWRDSTSLLGYYNPLTQTYEWTE